MTSRYVEPIRQAYSEASTYDGLTSRSQENTELPLLSLPPQMLSFLLIVRLSRLRPTALLQRIDRLIEPLRATVQSKVKANAVKQEHEKQEELKRSALKAVVALQTIPDSDKSVALMDFIAQVKSSPETASLFDSVQQDNSSPSLSEAMDIK
jgi:cullin-associated NEDD8-dissociated protein 1